MTGQALPASGGGATCDYPGRYGPFSPAPAFADLLNPSLGHLYSPWLLVQDIDLTFKDMRLFLLLVLGLLGIALVFYLSWLPQPRLSLTWFMPHWLAAWADAPSHNTVRTGVPFIFLGLLAGGWLSLAAYPRGSWLVCWLGLIGVAILAELGQLFLPYRIFDWWDVAWGATGAMVGLTVSATMVNLLKAFLGDRR